MQKSKAFWLPITHTNISSNHNKTRSITASETMTASLLHINTMPPQPGVYMPLLDSSTAYETICQARSASALVSILSAVATRKFAKRKETLACSYVKDMSRFVLTPARTCNVQSVRAWLGDREMCVCVSEWRKERSDKATQGGVGPRMARRRKR